MWHDADDFATSSVLGFSLDLGNELIEVYQNLDFRRLQQGFVARNKDDIQKRAKMRLSTFFQTCN